MFKALRARALEDIAAAMSRMPPRTESPIGSRSVQHSEIVGLIEIALESDDEILRGHAMLDVAQYWNELDKQPENDLKMKILCKVASRITDSRLDEDTKRVAAEAWLDSISAACVARQVRDSINDLLQKHNRGEHQGPGRCDEHGDASHASGPT